LRQNTTPRKHLLVVASVWPHVNGSFEAANVVTHSILSGLVAADVFHISFCYVNSCAAIIPKQAEPELEQLRMSGVTFLEPLILTKPSSLIRRPFSFIKALLFKPESILFGYGAGNSLSKRASGDIDAVLTIWSELGLNAACTVGKKRFAYHGNPDHKVLSAQYEVMRLAGIKPHAIKAILNRLRQNILIKLVERGHLRILRRYTFVSNVAANDASYYSLKGINSFYLQNMWPMLPPDNWETLRDQLESINSGKIIGNVGNLSATGNSLGFIALCKEILPKLEQLLPSKSYRVHIFGGREPKPFLKPLLTNPSILIRGFVDDLNIEILSAPVFLISNNHHEFKVGHTRFLHAWSTGACVVAFSDCRDAMPEIEHGYNALLGDTAQEVAQLVAQALSDRHLRRRIGRGGIETLQMKFNPSSVTNTLINNLLIPELNIV